MKRAAYGRALFGASAVLFGAITLMWHDPDTWQGLPILKLPFVISACLAIAQIVGGLGLAFSRTGRWAAIVLGAVYLIFSLACIPGMIAKPSVYVEYIGFFEWFSLVCGAAAAYAACESNMSRAASIGRAARLGLGVCTVSFALAQVAYFHLTASLVPTWIPPSQAFWTVLTTVAFALAAIAILINRQARLALRLMTLMLALFGVLVWVPLLVTHPESHGNWSEFTLNFLVTGAAWIVAEL
jgi:hypothetical protein